MLYDMYIYMYIYVTVYMTEDGWHCCTHVISISGGLKLGGSKRIHARCSVAMFQAAMFHMVSMKGIYCRP